MYTPRFLEHSLLFSCLGCLEFFLKHFSEARCSENEAEGWDGRFLAIFNGKILRGFLEVFLIKTPVFLLHSYLGITS